MPDRYCGVQWTTRDSKGVHEHLCRRPAGHRTRWHACLVDVDGSHVVERRAVAERIDS